MAKKKKKRTRDGWTPPPKSGERQAAERESRLRRATAGQPPLPQRRLILALSALACGTCAAFLVFWMPSHALVDDLRSRGVHAAAEIMAAPKNKYGDAGNIEVRFSRPGGAVETTLSDWGGKRPEGLRPGTLLPVTYDPQDPTRVLATRWVRKPPAMTLPMLVALMFTPLLLGFAVFLLLRRRTVLKARRTCPGRPPNRTHGAQGTDG